MNRTLVMTVYALAAGGVRDADGLDNCLLDNEPPICDNEL